MDVLLDWVLFDVMVVVDVVDVMEDEELDCGRVLCGMNMFWDLFEFIELLLLSVFYVGWDICGKVGGFVIVVIGESLGGGKFDVCEWRLVLLLGSWLCVVYLV